MPDPGIIVLPSIPIFSNMKPNSPTHSKSREKFLLYSQPSRFSAIALSTEAFYEIALTKKPHCNSASAWCQFAESRDRCYFY
jgi:hypothetical protein